MNDNFIQRLLYLEERLDYKLNTEFTNKKNQFIDIRINILKLKKDKIKLRNNLSYLNSEIRFKCKIQSRLYNDLRNFMNNKFPTFSIIVDKGKYVYCNIKLRGQKSIYIGSIDNVKKQFSKYQPELVTNKINKFKRHLSILLEQVLYDLIDFRLDNWNKTKVTSKDILDYLLNKVIRG